MSDKTDCSTTTKMFQSSFVLLFEPSSKPQTLEILTIDQKRGFHLFTLNCTFLQNTTNKSPIPRAPENIKKQKSKDTLGCTIPASGKDYAGKSARGPSRRHRHDRARRFPQPPLAFKAKATRYQHIQRCRSVSCQPAASDPLQFSNPPSSNISMSIRISGRLSRQRPSLRFLSCASACLPRAHGCGNRMQIPFENSFGSEAAVWKFEVTALGCQVCEAKPGRSAPPPAKLKILFHAENSSISSLLPR